jgi:hypothetical protein
MNHLRRDCMECVNVRDVSFEASPLDSRFSHSVAVLLSLIDRSHSTPVPEIRRRRVVQPPNIPARSTGTIERADINCQSIAIDGFIYNLEQWRIRRVL